jgi:prepilin peptidase CpaA
VVTYGFSSSILVALLLIASVTDLRGRRVPNLLTVLIAACGAGAQLVYHGPMAALSGLGASLLVVAMLWIPWDLGGIGGGDVKLAAAVAVWMGLSGLPVFVLAGAFAGGVVSWATYAASSVEARKTIRTHVARALVFRSWPSTATQSEGAKSVPYALAIAFGAVVGLLPLRWVTFGVLG